MAEKENSFQDRKVAVVLIGHVSQLSNAMACLKAALAVSSSHLSELKPSEKSIEDILRDLSAEDVFDDKYLERHLVCLTEERLHQLEEAVAVNDTVLRAELREMLPDKGMDYIFVGEKPKPQYFVPKSIGCINTRAKGGYRQRHFIITRPYMY